MEELTDPSIQITVSPFRDNPVVASEPPGRSMAAILLLFPTDYTSNCSKQCNINQLMVIITLCTQPTSRKPDQKSKSLVSGGIIVSGVASFGHGRRCAQTSIQLNVLMSPCGPRIIKTQVLSE
jgi:hypothetical protein